MTVSVHGEPHCSVVESAWKAVGGTCRQQHALRREARRRRRAGSALSGTSPAQRAATRALWSWTCGAFRWGRGGSGRRVDPVCGFRAHEGRVRLWPGAPLVRPKLFGYVHYYCLPDGLFHSCVVDSRNCPVAEQQDGLSGVRVIDDLFEAKRGQFIVECFRIHSSDVGRDYGGGWYSRSRCRGRHNGRSNRFGCDHGGRRHCCRCSNGCRGRLGNGMRDGWSCLRGSRAARKGQAQERAAGQCCREFQT